MFSYLTTLSTVLMLASCTVFPSNSQETIDTTTNLITLRKGDVYVAEAICAPNPSVTPDWLTNNNQVVIVDHGLILAIGVGIARITVECNKGISTIIKVIVAPAKLTTARIVPEIVDITSGDTLPMTLLATYSDFNTYDISASISGDWKSFDTKIAHVINNKLITGQPGTTSISITLGDIEVISTINVLSK